MVDRIYSFQEQYNHGQRGEQQIARWLQPVYSIDFVTDQQQQNQGIDLIGTHRQTGECVSFEVKTDRAAHRTGNAFIEVVGNSSRGSIGWVQKCKADWLIYWVPGLRRIYQIRPYELRVALKDWQYDYSLKSSQNPTYSTHGFVVPLDELETVATVVSENTGMIL